MTFSLYIFDMKIDVASRIAEAEMRYRIVFPVL